MKRFPAVLLCSALLAALAGCGGITDDPVLTAPSSPTTATPSASASASASAPASGSASAGASPAATGALEPSAPAFPANTEVDTEEPTGGPLSVVSVRAARQEGYDRVVFELGGTQAGQPGWRVEYTDDPAQQGSGNRVEVKGPETLAVIITGVGYPMDTGVTEARGKPALPADLSVVQDVVLGATFEGQYQAFLGTSRKAPFRVFRLADPARVVIDVRSG